ncbi:hypothetical protein KC19_7G084400 [Ceratodon purpureus]|uniref:Uncharacterized protein n=1 Tax=Ceratodon purpureus TaxID=3225 RepID=A0A8T0HCC3_CERPU|nr:hypothetical protein KC19_7G084400 [Ceratodon purpureus]
MSKIAGSILRYFKPLEIDFLDLCEQNLQSIADLVSRGSLLNRRQCLDLSTKLSQTTQNIRQLVDQCGGGSTNLFRSALENLFRYLEKAKVLVSKCGDEHWWVAATFQIRNENAFREILLEVSLCYNTIYELAKSGSEKSDVLPDDLRQPPAAVFAPAIARDVQKDQQDIQQRLEELANSPSSVQLQGLPLTEEVALKAQSLARYLLLRMRYASQQSLATTLDTFCEILWRKDTEPPGTWGNSYYLGGGATEGRCLED